MNEKKLNCSVLVLTRQFRKSSQPCFVCRSFRFTKCSTFSPGPLKTLATVHHAVNGNDIKSQQNDLAFAAFLHYCYYWLLLFLVFFYLSYTHPTTHKLSLPLSHIITPSSPFQMIYSLAHSLKHSLSFSLTGFFFLSYSITISFTPSLFPLFLLFFTPSLPSFFSLAVSINSFQIPPSLPFSLSFTINSCQSGKKVDAELIFVYLFFAWLDPVGIENQLLNDDNRLETENITYFVIIPTSLNEGFPKIFQAERFAAR